MTDMLDVYRALRADGRSHSSACAELARQLAVDPPTIHRVIRRAEAAENPGGGDPDGRGGAAATRATHGEKNFGLLHAEAT